jgi:hypothetical protein
LKRRGIASTPEDEPAMKDLAYVALTVLFFALSWLYVRACERV